MATEAPPSPDRQAVRRTLLVVAATAAIAVGAFAVAGAVTHDDNSGSPQHAVRDFLIDAGPDDDGFGACRYLTPRARRAVEAREPRDMSCEAAMSSYAQLQLGGETVDTEAAVKHLTYAVAREAGGRVRVTVTVNGARRAFVLRRATARELGEFAAPPTPWRIDSGATGLLAR